MLETKIVKNNDAAQGRFFDDSEYILKPARLQIKPLTEAARLACQNFVGLWINEVIETIRSPETTDKLKLADSKAVIKSTAESIAALLQTELGRGMLTIGDHRYFMTDDPHAISGNHNWLIRLADYSIKNTGWVSFQESRGLMADEGMTMANCEHHIDLIQDVITCAAD